jgi:hypothetical protein
MTRIMFMHKISCCEENDSFRTTYEHFVVFMSLCDISVPNNYYITGKLFMKYYSCEFINYKKQEKLGNTVPRLFIIRTKENYMWESNFTDILYVSGD